MTIQNGGRGLERSFGHTLIIAAADAVLRGPSSNSDESLPVASVVDLFVIVIIIIIMPRLIRPQNLNDAFLSAAKQTRQKALALTPNQEVGIYFYLPMADVPLLQKNPCNGHCLYREWKTKNLHV
jgi:hypothetical protein